MTLLSDLSPLTVRLFLGSIIFPHGAQKLFGWFGGYGFNGTMQYFTQTVGIPYVLGLLVIVIETLGALSIIVGWYTRFWAFAMTVVMAGIIITNFSGYFFMNWFGNQKTEGMEFFLLAIGMGLALNFGGAGKYSIDALLERKKLTPTFAGYEA